MTRKSTNAPRLHHDPFPHPSWRWQAAADSLQHQRPPGHSDDPAIADAARFHHALVTATDDASRAALRSHMPHLSAAHDLYTGTTVLRDEVEARLLAGESFEAIAAKARIRTSVVEAYERFFFNVADALHATDWLMTKVLDVAAWRGRLPTEGEVWRYSALSGGPFVLDLLIADHLGRAEPRYPDRPLLAEKARYLVREFTTDWTDRAAAAAIVAEGCRLFGSCPQADLASRRFMASQQRLLRLTYRRKPASTSKPKRSTLNLQPGEGLPAEEYAHGSPQVKD